jgi:methionyl-tRNA formyltransferase
MRIAFAGTPAFAAVALSHLLECGFDVALVLTQPDRPAGRGQQPQPSAVKRIAVELGLRVAQPQGLRLDGRYADDAKQAQRALVDAKVDAMVVVAYGLILPAWVLATPRLGCVNIHASLLPRWRGAAPIQRALEAGDARTGITIIRMDEGLDTGPMLAREALMIAPDDTSQTLHDRLAPVGARLVADVLTRLRDRAVVDATIQPDDGVTYAAKLTKEEAAIDWRESAAALERRLRAFDPAPGCTFEHEGQMLKLWRGRVVEPLDSSMAPGSVHISAQGVVVACGEGALELVEVQKAGGRRITAAAWAQGIKR